MTNPVCKRETGHIERTVDLLMRTHSSHPMAMALIFTDTKHGLDMYQRLQEVWKTHTKNS